MIEKSVKQPLKRISLWSGPRNVSTALMYSFAQRESCTVVDEPLYGYYLAKTNLDHPGKEEILRSMHTDSEVVTKSVLLEKYQTEEVFFKNMAHHFIELPWELLDSFANIFLVREPRFVIESYIKKIKNPSADDLGYPLLMRMTEYLESRNQPLFVIDTKEILQNPIASIRSMCEFAGIEFQVNMLNWNAGARAEDGIWAKYWYHNVHLSTGFNAYEDRDVNIPISQIPLLEQCDEMYKVLKRGLLELIRSYGKCQTAI